SRGDRGRRGRDWPITLRGCRKRLIRWPAADSAAFPSRKAGGYRSKSPPTSGLPPPRQALPCNRSSIRGDRRLPVGLFLAPPVLTTSQNSPFLRDVRKIKQT